MINNITSSLYTRLRQRSGLTRKQFAARIEIGRDTLRNYEAGVTRPDPAIENKMLEVTHCSKLELAELFGEILSEELGVRVGVDDEQKGYRPGPLAGAEQTLRRYGDELSDVERRTLDNKMHTAQLMRLVWERQIADLDENVADLGSSALRRRAGHDAPIEGATEPAAVAGAVFHNAAAGRRAATTDEG